MRLMVQQYNDDNIVILTYSGQLDEPMPAEDRRALNSIFSDAESPLFVIINVHGLQADLPDIVNFLKTTRFSMMEYADIARELYAIPPVFVGSNQIVDLYMKHAQQGLFGVGQSPVFSHVDDAIQYIQQQKPLAGGLPVSRK